jgi:Kef-type K+ transport system membrane component KefB
MNRISIKGVAIGNLIDVALEYLVGIPIGVFMLMRGYPIDKPALLDNGSFFAAAVVLGSLCSILGGYVAARIAKHDEILNGALSSLLVVGIGVHAVINGDAAGHLVRDTAFLPLSPVLAAFGGYLRFRRLVRQR